MEQIASERQWEERKNEKLDDDEGWEWEVKDGRSIRKEDEKKNSRKSEGEQSQEVDSRPGGVGRDILG